MCIYIYIHMLYIYIYYVVCWILVSLLRLGMNLCALTTPVANVGEAWGLRGAAAFQTKILLIDPGKSQRGSQT